MPPLLLRLLVRVMTQNATIIFIISADIAVGTIVTIAVIIIIIIIITSSTIIAIIVRQMTGVAVVAVIRAVPFRAGASLGLGELEIIPERAHEERGGLTEQERMDGEGNVPKNMFFLAGDDDGDDGSLSARVDHGIKHPHGVDMESSLYGAKELISGGQRFDAGAPQGVAHQ
uniref:Uncharacterized protein n=1 Tax=Anopheles atroparvus TaxID=41427 RepID=A0A182IUG4_ANOAO